MNIEELMAYLMDIQLQKGAKYVEFDRLDVYDEDSNVVGVVR